MTLSNSDFEDMLKDGSKRIEGDVIWQNDPQRDLLLKFKAEIISALNLHKLSMRGTYNPIIDALSYHIICPPYGRIYGLDLGKEHKNPDGKLVGEKHKHRWTEIYRDKQAYVPADITTAGNNPVGVWQQFCEEAIIKHNGVMQPPPPSQLGLFL
jgi:hypothetical protein